MMKRQRAQQIAVERSIATSISCPQGLRYLFPGLKVGQECVKPPAPIGKIAPFDTTPTTPDLAP